MHRSINNSIIFILDDIHKRLNIILKYSIIILNRENEFDQIPLIYPNNTYFHSFLIFTQLLKNTIIMIKQVINTITIIINYFQLKT